MTQFDIISKREAEWLSELETKISMGMKTFVEVGNALLEIRDNRLYRESHKTFEDYCQEKWGMSRRHSNRLIQSASVINSLSQDLGPTGPIQPTSERQARPLTRLSAPLQEEAWERAVETAPKGRITANHVQRVVREIEGIETEKKVTIIKQRINKEDLITSDFEAAYEKFFEQVQLSKMEAWKNTSRESAQARVNWVNDLINI